jgi:hypothetical protein
LEEEFVTWAIKIKEKVNMHEEELTNKKIKIIEKL